MNGSTKAVHCLNLINNVLPNQHFVVSSKETSYLIHFRGLFELTAHSIVENSNKNEFSSTNRTFDLVSAAAYLAIKLVIQQVNIFLL